MLENEEEEELQGVHRTLIEGGGGGRGEEGREAGAATGWEKRRNWR